MSIFGAVLMMNRIADTVANSFSFTSVTNGSASTQYTSNTVTVSGLEPNFDGLQVTVSGGTVDAGTSVLSGTFSTSKTVTTSSTGTIVVAARGTSSSTFGGTVNVTVTVGTTTSATFSITTAHVFTGQSASTSMIGLRVGPETGGTTTVGPVFTSSAGAPTLVSAIVNPGGTDVTSGSSLVLASGTSYNVVYPLNVADLTLSPRTLTVTASRSGFSNQVGTVTITVTPRATPSSFVVIRNSTQTVVSSLAAGNAVTFQHNLSGTYSAITNIQTLSGSLPPGVTLNTVEGYNQNNGFLLSGNVGPRRRVIASGTPTTPGSYSYSFRLTFDPKETNVTTQDYTVSFTVT